jgi:ArsR family transcriptional regulator
VTAMRELEKLFKGLADVTRLRILNLLLHGEFCVCDVQQIIGALQPNISRHLTYLKNSGLVLDRRDGPRICYRLAEPTDSARKQLFSFLQAVFIEDPAFTSDAQKLRDAIESGACNAKQWRPYSGLNRLLGDVKQPA